MARAEKISLVSRNLPVTVDRQLLRQAVATIAKPGGEQSWCVACGAGAEASPVDKVSDVQTMTREFLGGRSLSEFVAELKDIGEQAWCVACGAGKDASPIDLITDPVALPDELIDQLAERMISAVRLG